MSDISKDEWVAILKNSREQLSSWGDGREESILAYLAGAVFGINTYDSEMDSLFASKAIEVTSVISDGATFEYIKDPEKYQWYLILCHLPFFAERIEWGGSIRGAWWVHEDVKFQSCGIFDGEDQLSEDITFTKEGWQAFMAAVVEFGQGDAA